MARSPIKYYAVVAVILIAGFASAASLSVSLEESRPPLPPGYSDSDLRVKGSRLRGFAFGMDGLIADWYYMRSLQYIGDKVLSAESDQIDLDDLRSLDPRLLYPLLDTAADLDPNFLAVYEYGAVVLPAIDGDQAISLTKKGIEHNPGAWRLYQHLGFIYWKLGDHDKAADAYQAGSQIEGAAPFMAIMVGAMKTAGGSRSTARQIFEQMRSSTTDPAVKNTAERRLAQLDAIDQREAIDSALTTFKERTGRCPSNINEIVPMLAGIKLPGGAEFRVDASNRLIDPTGQPFMLDKENCRVRIPAP